jgi:hypothetical protein
MQETETAHVQMTLRRAALFAIGWILVLGGYRGVVSSDRAGSPSHISWRPDADSSICMAAASVTRMSRAAPCTKALSWSFSRLGVEVAEPLQVQSGQFGFAIQSLRI